ncbi:MAG: hypothetical protein VZR24_16525 [Butyrivibrio hungatei]|nr:hypothetical protein [Butyrivibrio hungatei]
MRNLSDEKDHYRLVLPTDELAIFMNPASVYQLTFSYEGSELPPYMICRDGLAAVNIACNIFWITLSSGIGVSVFRKREVAS